MRLVKLKHLVIGLTLAVWITSCGRSDSTVPTATNGPIQTPRASATDAGNGQTAGSTALPTVQATSTETPAPTVSIGETSLGDILVSSQGFTLYAFTRDSTDESACTGSCADLWPPLTVEGQPVAGEGVEVSLLGTMSRPDGSNQVTYAGHPLYRFSEDAGPGDSNGQGFGGVWFVLGADGELVQETGSGPIEMEDPYYPY